MVVRLLHFCLCLLLLSACAIADEQIDPVKQAFESYFKQPFEYTSKSDKVELVVNKGEAVAESTLVRIKLNVSNVTQVLLLKTKNAGYYRNGMLNAQCAQEPVYLASYNLNPQASVKELACYITTHCDQHDINLLVWVKTTDGNLYSDSITFRTLYESPG